MKVATARWSRSSLIRSVFALLAVFAILGVSTPASAHTGDQSYLYLEITDQVWLDLHMPFGDIAEHLGIEIDGTDAEIDQRISEHAEELAGYARDHFEVAGPDGTLTTSGFTVQRFQETEYVGARFTVDAAPADIPNQLDIRLDPFFDENPDRDALFLIFNDWERGYVNNEADPLARFTADTAVQTIDIGDRSWVKNFTSSVSLGLDHIKTGPDHILFVAVLILPSVLAFAGRWRPTDRFGRSLWRVLKVVSMFTLAHSITFTLAGLSLIPLPGPRFTETIIALSIAAAALHNIRPIAPQREWMIAFAFGLFHGLGFASLVDDLQISQSTQLVSLLGRNVGIEIGQALVVIAVFPALFLLRRTRWYMPFFTISSIVLVVVSLGWMAERLFDAPDVTSKVVELAIEWPRIVWIVAAFTVASALAWWSQSRTDQLLPVAPTSEPVEDLVSSG